MWLFSPISWIWKDTPREKRQFKKTSAKDCWFAADVFLVPKLTFPNLVSRVLSYYTSPENEGRLFHHVAADVRAAMLVDLPKKGVFLRFFSCKFCGKMYWFIHKHAALPTLFPRMLGIYIVYTSLYHQKRRSKQEWKLEQWESVFASKFWSFWRDGFYDQEQCSRATPCYDQKEDCSWRKIVFDWVCCHLCEWQISNSIWSGNQT